MFGKVFQKSGKSQKSSKAPLKTVSLADTRRFKGINIIVLEKGGEPKKVFVNKIFSPSLVDNDKKGKSKRLSESSLADMALSGGLVKIRFVSPDDYLRGTARASLNELMKEHGLSTDKAYVVAGCQMK